MKRIAEWTISIRINLPRGVDVLGILSSSWARDFRDFYREIAYYRKTRANANSPKGIAGVLKRHVNWICNYTGGLQGSMRFFSEDL